MTILIVVWALSFLFALLDTFDIITVDTWVTVLNSVVLVVASIPLARKYFFVRPK